MKAKILLAGRQHDSFDVELPAWLELSAPTLKNGREEWAYWSHQLSEGETFDVGTAVHFDVHSGYSDLFEILKLIRPQSTTWRDVSFPSGSHYKSEYLIDGEYPVDDENVIYISDRGGLGWLVTHGQMIDGEWETSQQIFIEPRRCGVGAGNDLGEFFCSRDQQLSVFTGSTLGWKDVTGYWNG